MASPSHRPDGNLPDMGGPAGGGSPWLPRRRGRTLFACLAVVVAVAAWQWVTWEEVTPRDGSAWSASAAAKPGLTVYKPDERIVAPEISGVTLDGDDLSTTDMLGEVVVVNIWGSWCGPCRTEAPDLARAARTTQARGVKFVGIDTRDNAPAARAFVRAFKIPYPSIIDTAGETMLPLAEVIPLSAVPSTIVIDPEGRVAATVVGTVTYSTLVGLVRAELASGAADGG